MSEPRGMGDDQQEGVHEVQAKPPFVLRAVYDRLQRELADRDARIKELEEELRGVIAEGWVCQHVRRVAEGWVCRFCGTFVPLGRESEHDHD